MVNKTVKHSANTILKLPKHEASEVMFNGQLCLKTASHLPAIPHSQLASLRDEIEVAAPVESRRDGKELFTYWPLEPLRKIARGESMAKVEGKTDIALHQQRIKRELATISKKAAIPGRQTEAQPRATLTMRKKELPVTATKPDRHHHRQDKQPQTADHDRKKEAVPPIATQPLPVNEPTMPAPSSEAIATLKTIDAMLKKMHKAGRLKRTYSGHALIDPQSDIARTVAGDETLKQYGLIEPSATEEIKINRKKLHELLATHGISGDQPSR